MSKKLAEGWREACIHAQCTERATTICLPVICQDGDDWRDNEWFPAHAAPDRAFEPAEPDALGGSERMYVDNPEMDGFDRMTGWADIVPRRALNPNKVFVRFVGERFCHPVLRAACRREGPQCPPPDESAVFLGRHESPRGNSDMWRLPNGRLCADDFGVEWSPKEIEGPSNLADDWRPLYRDALARARALGLVEAEPERATRIVCDGCGVEASCRSQLGSGHGIHHNHTDPPEFCGHYIEVPAEPERAEPKFQVGQMAEWGTPENLIVMRITSEPDWHAEDRTWVYSAETLAGFATVYGETDGRDGSLDLRPHTMTIADVPDGVLLAIVRGRPMRVVDVPVTHEGLPYSEKHGSAEADWCLRGKHVAVRELAAINDARGHSLVVLPDARSLWPWNLELVTKAEPD